MKHSVKARQYNSKNCFVCGVENDASLHTRFYETEAGELVAVSHPELHHQSYPGRVHGGVSAALLDETMGRAISVLHDKTVWGVTLELTTKYRKPVPYDCEIKCVARVVADYGRMFEATGEIYLPDGQLAVTASGRYMKQPAEKIAGEGFEDNEWGYVTGEPLPESIEI